MSDNVIKEPVAEVTATPETQAEKTAEAKKEASKSSKGGEMKFFRNCSASLKRFSILLFVINIFLAITLVGVGTVVLGVYVGFELIALITLPIITFLIILIVLARFLSALIYGFAEIVEKAEK